MTWICMCTDKAAIFLMKVSFINKDIKLILSNKLWILLTSDKEITIYGQIFTQTRSGQFNTICESRLAIKHRSDILELFTITRNIERSILPQRKFQLTLINMKGFANTACIIKVLLLHFECTHLEKSFTSLRQTISSTNYTLECCFKIYSFLRKEFGNLYS